MPSSPQDRQSRREDQRRATRRRRVAAGLAVIVVGAGVGLAAALATTADEPSPTQPATEIAAAPATTTAPAPKATPARTVPRLPPIAKLRPGTAQVITRGPTQGGKVALTFDDGFCPACVKELVDQLERTGAPATLFPNGTYAKSWEPQAKRIRDLVATGQVVVGSHTFSHGDAKTQSSETFSADLARNEEWIQKTFRVSGRPWLRPPFGSYNDATLAAAGALGYTRVIMWSGTTADSSPQTVPYLLNAVRYWAKPGVIMLMHANYPNTARALPRMLRILRKRDLTPVTIAELVGDPADTGAATGTR